MHAKPNVYSRFPRTAPGLTLAALLACVVLPSSAVGQFVFENVVDNTGPFLEFLAPPSMNNAGTVAVVARRNDGKTVVLKFSNSSTPTVVAETGTDFQSFGSEATVNAVGQVVYHARVSTNPAQRTMRDAKVMLTAGFGPLATGPLIAGVGRRPAINTWGTIVMPVEFDLCDTDRGEPIFYGDGIVVTEDNGPFVDQKIMLWTQVWDIGLHGCEAGPDDAFFDVASLYRTSSASWGISDNNRVAFLAFLESGVVAISTFDASQDIAAPTTVVSTGSDFASFGENIAINSSGSEIAFTTTLSNGRGAVMATSLLGISQELATTSDTLWGMKGFKDRVTINNDGQVAFIAALPTHAPVPPSFDGLFVRDAGTCAFQSPRLVWPGLVIGVGLGHALFGSTVASLDISTSALNDNGTLAFAYELADGRSGIAKAIPLDAQPTSRTLYVDDDSTAPNATGTRWCSAFPRLGDALAAAQSGDSILVAGGTYTPDPSGLTDPREATFALVDGVAIFGGYAGCGSASPDHRHLARYPTVLSGDLLSNDGPITDPTLLLDDPTRNDNCYNVLRGVDVREGTTLDGLQVVRGQANGESAVLRQDSGGGLVLTNSEITVRSCEFRNNASKRWGGAVHDSNPPFLAQSVFVESHFESNYSFGTGGALMSFGPVLLSECTFIRNAARTAGAVLSADTTVRHSTFYANEALGSGGAIAVRGGQTRIVNSVFASNHASVDGGAISADRGGVLAVGSLFSGNSAGRNGGAAQMVAQFSRFINCTFSGNSAEAGGSLFNSLPPFKIKNPIPHVIANSIFWSSTPDAIAGVDLWEVADSNIQGGFPGIRIIDSDPRFVRPSGLDGIPGTLDDDLRLQAISPCIDAGNDPGSALDFLDIDGDCDETELVPFDVIGIPRVIDDVRVPDGGADGTSVIDMGAFERDPLCRGNSSFDCNSNGLVDACEVFEGVSPDCNANLVPDACEIGCDVAIVEGVSDGESVLLSPVLGSDTSSGSQVEFTNQSGIGGADASASETADAVFPDTVGFDGLGTSLIVDTSLQDGLFQMKVSIPFDAAALGGRDPLSVDLAWFNNSEGAWAPAGQGNTRNSTGHAGRLGDRSVVVGDTSPAIGSLSTELGSYGVFWNPSEQIGFAWANVDHTSTFSSGFLTCPPVLRPGTETPIEVTKNRFLTVSGGNRGRQTAIRVTLVSLPAPFDGWNRDTLWIGPPSEVSELGGSVSPSPGSDTFLAARLQCEPFYTDWDALGTVHVFHEGIVPGGAYRLQVTDVTCSDLSSEDSFSEGLALSTAKWGDTVLNLADTPPAPPEGLINIVDVVAILDRFASVSGSIVKARADLEPACLDLTINITDVVSSLDSFSGSSYPFAPTAANPCESTCPNPLP